ncbi:hypothetical protein BVRB_9g225560 [Beta vulgaris subsp. vulgaris]|uniref:Uncharacterized protein n=1 Tax=Beta vulgaris subsp. vulgaris TaxID=3555 RepID=A0A0J8DZU1_BETVV|nr:hypothetical protein BVRB_9g225560 [Beta vulgaris subsp. vulgaris]
MKHLKPIAHILIFPLPIQGPVNSMLKLAELILLASDAQIHITFLTTELVHRRLMLHANAASRFESYPGFSLRTFSDGLPEDHPRGSDKFGEMVDAVEAVSRPLLREMLVTDRANSPQEIPITCIIPDGSYNFALDVGKEVGIPVIYFDTISPSCLWVYLCLPKLIEDGEVPFQDAIILAMARTSKQQKTQCKPKGPVSDSNAKKTKSMDELLGVQAMEVEMKNNDDSDLLELQKTQQSHRMFSEWLTSMNSEAEKIGKEQRGKLSWADRSVREVDPIPIMQLSDNEFVSENWEMEAIVGVPGIGTLLRRRDFPDFCRANNPASDVMIQRISKQAKQFRKASGFILNTFEDLEAPLLSYMRSHFPNMYVVGPLHLHLKERILRKETTTSTTLLSYCSNSLWHEDKSCIEWLDAQPLRSVIFCSFGSHVCLTKEQLMEFWQGLVNSGTRFLWIKRQRSVTGMDDDVHKWQEQIPSGLLKGMKENGYVTSWAPQEEVLSHPSIGGFLTHSGWNSTLESIVEGKPMLCWPYYVDQLIISRYVSHVWKVGLDMKDICDRDIIENMVRDLMDRRRGEYSQNVNALAYLARQSVHEDGSSYCSLNKLVDDIMSLKLPA